MNKTLLIIENEWFNKKETFHFDYENDFNDIIIVDGLLYDQSKSDLLKNVITTKHITDILFQTTWLYESSTSAIYNILKKIPHSLNIWCVSSQNPCSQILSAINIKTREDYDIYLEQKKHNFYRLNNDNHSYRNPEKCEWILSNEKLEESLNDIILSEIKTDNKKKEDDLRKIELDFIMKNPTNEYIKICVINAVGKEWSELKNGDIVPILKTPSTDGNPNWGVWVKGKTEPVKLLNSDFHREYEYLGKKDHDGKYELTCSGIAREIVSSIRNRGIERNSMISMLTIKINRIGSYIKNENDIHFFVQYELLDFAGVPRRYYRPYFVDKLTTYYKEHTFFREFDLIKEKELYKSL